MSTIFYLLSIACFLVGTISTLTGDGLFGLIFLVLGFSIRNGATLEEIKEKLKL